MPDAMAPKFGLKHKNIIMKVRSYTLLLWLMPFVVSAQSVKVFSEKDVDWKAYNSFTVAEGELVTVLKTLCKVKVVQAIMLTNLVK